MSIIGGGNFAYQKIAISHGTIVLEFPRDARHPLLRVLIWIPCLKIIFPFDAELLDEAMTDDLMCEEYGSRDRAESAVFMMDCWVNRFAFTMKITGSVVFLSFIMLRGDASQQP